MPDIMLADVETLKRRLKITHNDDDDDLELVLAVASSRVVVYLDKRADEVLDLDSSGELTSGSDVPPAIEMATLYLAAIAVRNPDGMGGDFDGGELPDPVKAWLKPFREPPLA